MALKIIGAGMGRTGTASLKVAIEALGIGQCYHMTEVFKNPQSSADWIDAAHGHANWDKIFDGYAATVDNPGCNYWKELANFYPDAKVILTIRDAAKWFESTNETIHSAEFAKYIENSPFGKMIQKTMWDGMQNRMQDREHMIDFFESRTKEIINTIPAEKLLVYRVADGWEPLCKFLNLPVPDMDFPNLNSRDETAKLLSNLMAASGDELSDEAMSDAGHELHGE